MGLNNILEHISNRRYMSRIVRNEEQKLRARYSNTKIIHLSKTENEKIMSVWGTIISKYKINVKWFELYHSLWPNINPADFIPDSLFFSVMDQKLNNKVASKIFDDKNLYDLYFQGYDMPKTIGRRINGVFFNSQFQMITIQELESLCASEERVVLKPAKDTCGGSGIYFWNSSSDNMDILETELKRNNNLIVQSVVVQNKALSELHKNSVNTLRLLTYSNESGVKVLSRVVRMGANGSYLDNTSSGGLSCGVSDDGSLKNYAFTIKGEKHFIHPQGTKFSDIVIPNIKECDLLVKTLAGRFYGISRMISWDLAIGENGKPIIIEVNLSAGGINFHQMNNGPVFSAIIPELIELIENN